jgi:sulfotransferase
MPSRFHFISGLPRAGSTLLAAILRQNPALRAGVTSPVGAMVAAMLGEMSAGSEGAVFFDDGQREAVLRGCFENYYHAAGDRTVFDTSRVWTSRIDLLAKLFPACKVICCVRQPPWILDSVEWLIRRNTYELSGLFGFDRSGTVYSRAEVLMSNAGMIGFAINALKQAMHGAQSSRLLLLPYDVLAGDPAAAMAAVYTFTGLPPFSHDFQNLDFDTEEFDARLGTPGLHRVRSSVSRIERPTILPPDLWRRFENAGVWRSAEFNTRAVSIVGVASEAPA